MPETNPLLLADELRGALSRYLPTALPISRSYPRLRAERERILAEYPLVKGPFIEGLPDFEKGAALRDLLRCHGGFLNDGLGLLPAAILDRPLYG
ncbi:MAG: hypothetical protein ACRD2F_01880, partial [Terriglobales bacterium]